MADLEGMGLWGVGSLLIENFKQKLVFFAILKSSTFPFLGTEKVQTWVAPSPFKFSWIRHSREDTRSRE